MQRTITLSCAFALAAVSPAAADGPFTITRSVIGGGGGTSSGGGFTVTGTVGETAAGSEVSYGNKFDLAAGFWAGHPAVMWPALTPEPPIAQGANEIRRITWSPSRNGWAVQYSENMATWIRSQLPASTTAGFSGTAGFLIPAGTPRFYLRMVRLPVP